MPDDKPTKKEAPKEPLVPADRHLLAAQRQTLVMNRAVLDPPKDPTVDAQLKELDRQIAEIDKQLA